MLNNLITDNNVSYQGDVTLTIKNNCGTYKLPVKNRGTAHLFNTITRALCGQDISDDRPYYINMICKRIDGSTVELLTNRYVPITGQGYDNRVNSDNSSSVILNALILPSYKAFKIDLAEEDKIYLNLYSRDKSNILADVTGDTLIDAYNALQDGSEIVVNWKMTFSNK